MLFSVQIHSKNFCCFFSLALIGGIIVLIVMLGTSAKREASMSDGDKVAVPISGDLEKVEKSPNPVHSSLASGKQDDTQVDESTDSENDPAAGPHTTFRRKLSTNKQIKTTVSKKKKLSNFF